MIQKTKKLKICFTFTFPVAVINADFLTNIPVRMKHLMGEHIDLSVLYGGTLNEDILTTNGIKPYKIKPLVFAKLPVFIRCWVLAFAVYRQARRQKIQIAMNANNHYYSFFVSLGARLAGAKSVARVTGILEASSALSFRKLLKKSMGRLLERLSLAFANGVFAVSQSLKDILVRRGNRPDKINVISTGIDTDRFLMRSDDRIKSKPQKLLYVGRITKGKGLEYSIEAFIEVSKDYPGLKLVICGDGGEYMYILRNKYQNVSNLVFKGYVSYNFLASLYKDCDIFVFPSLSEGLPNAVLEAMASGLPVIATKIPVNSLLLDEGKRGILVEPCNVKQIIEGIRTFIDNVEFRINCVEASRRYIEKNHSFEAVRGKYLSFFENVLNQY